jgi:glycosyltransferase involved in cell wall biosynthesis
MLSYAVITPARDEEANLGRLASALAAQEVMPSRWLVVDNGSTDGTSQLLNRLSGELPWLRVVTTGGTPTPRREAVIARALEAGLLALDLEPDVLLKLDADIAFEPDYCARLLAAFERDPKLGIASGSCWELEDGEWVQRYMTWATVWGAARSFRWNCLQEILPLEERLGWDGIDVIKANLRGWRTETMHDLAFQHHRPEGEREGSVARAWEAEGRVAYYMHYRISYLLFRALHRARRHPAALAFVWGYLCAMFRRESRCTDRQVWRYLREQQRLRVLPLRAREAMGRR